MKSQNIYLLKYSGYGYGDGDGYGDGYGDGDGNGYGYGNGNGDGYGDGNGYGYGNGYGDGYGNGNGYGDGYGDGYGNGNGNGDGYGDGYGDGNGDGYGNGNGNGDGYGNGNGNGNGVNKIKIWGEWFEVSGKIENSLCKNIPSHHYDKVDKNFLYAIDNLECLRELREKIGLEKYISLFDAKVINEETDNQGFPMKLYKYDEKGTDVLLLEVVCPSTGRLYHLYPPNQKAKTCFEAKASTFGKSAAIFKTKFSES